MSILGLEIGLAQQMATMFTGNATVIPTCTFLGTYSLSPNSCDGALLANDGNQGVRLVTSSGNNVGNGWFLSAVTSVDTPQEKGTIGLEYGSDTALFAVGDGTDSTVSLTIGAGTSLIPEGANPEEAEVTGFCNLVRLKDPSSGLYLSVDGCDSPTFGLSELNNSTTLFTVESLSQFELIPNHEEDAAVSSYLGDSGVEFFHQNPNSTIVDSLVFPQGLIYVGLDDSDLVIGFICPVSSSDGLTIEVQIGQVGGMIDPATGAAMIVMDDVQWLVFGEVPGPNGTMSISKENGFKSVLGNVTGGTLLTLPTVRVTSSLPNNTALTAMVPAVTIGPPANSTQEDIAMVTFLSETVFESMQPDTRVFWLLNMEAQETAQPGQYTGLATDQNQGTGEGGTAVTPTASSPSPAPTSSESNMSVSLIWSLLALVYWLQ